MENILTLLLLTLSNRPWVKNGSYSDKEQKLIDPFTIPLYFDISFYFSFGLLSTSVSSSLLFALPTLSYLSAFRSRHPFPKFLFIWSDTVPGPPVHLELFPLLDVSLL